MTEERQQHPGVEVRDIVTIDELRITEDIQREVWGLDDIDIVPAAQMKAAVHAGGQVSGAFEDGVMIGFAYGIVATPHGPGMTGIGLHSHMVAVRERGRQRGVGRALKWYQRLWCLERGLTWITWTFDPLQARNAKLNFEHLGVVSHEYLVDFYGAMAGPLGGTDSDRLVALWLLDSEVVTRHAAQWAEGAQLQEEDVSAARGAFGDVWVLREEDVAAVGAHAAAVEQENRRRLEAVLAHSHSTSRLRVAAPHDVGALKRSQPGVVERWRNGLRASMLPALAGGYSVVGFADGAYVLVRM